MKFTALISLLVIAVPSDAFVPSQRLFNRNALPVLRMSDDATTPSEPAAPATPAATAEAPAAPKEEATADSTGSLVPIKEETVEFTAGILGGVAGLAVGGPVLGAIGAAAANYASKSGGEVSEVVSAVSKSSIQVYNYLAGLDKKYEVLKKAQDSLSAALDKLKAQDNVDPAVVKKVDEALAATTAKISEVNDEYDLVGGGVTALGIVGDLVEKAVDKVGELNEEYKLTDKAKTALSSAVDKAKSAAAEATKK